MKYRAKQGEMVDEIALHELGSSAQTEAIYALNPGLAALGPRLPMGVELELPEPERAISRQPIRLWS